MQACLFIEQALYALLCSITHPGSRGLARELNIKPKY